MKIKGMGIWIYKNQRRENLFALARTYPNGRLKSRVIAESMRTAVNLLWKSIAGKYMKEGIQVKPFLEYACQVVLYKDTSCYLVEDIVSPRSFRNLSYIIIQWQALP